MKKMLAFMLVVLAIAFLAVTNPTTEEYAQWYVDQSFPDRDSTMDDLIAQFNQHMASSAMRKDYLVCSVYDYDDHKTLMDIRIFVDTDADIRLCRRIQRDVMERGRTVESVLTQYQKTVQPMYLRFVEPTKRYATMIVYGGMDDHVRSMLFNHITHYLD